MEKEQHIAKLLNEWKSYREIAKKLSCSHQLISKVSKELNKEIKQDSYLQDIDKSNSKWELGRLKGKYHDALEELQQKELMLAFKERIVKDNGTIKIWKPIKWDKTESTAVLLASDWHAEETVDPDTINGLNEFNLDIAQERGKYFFQNWLRLVNMMAKEEKIENVVLWLLWDFISGYIHPELVENNGMSPTESILLVKKLLIGWIDHILENSDYKLKIVTAFWNHWRTTDKTRISTGWKNSYEWMMYNIIADHYINNDRVVFKIEKGYHNYLQVYNKVLRFHHGDWMKYQWGVGGITIPVNKAIAQWNKAKHADIDCFWHRHQLKDGGMWVCNGSLIWYWPYAERIKADYEEPKQAMFLINSKFWKTISAPILLTNV